MIVLFHIQETNCYYNELQYLMHNSETTEGNLKKFRGKNLNRLEKFVKCARRASASQEPKCFHLIMGRELHKAGVTRVRHPSLDHKLFSFFYVFLMQALCAELVSSIRKRM